MSSAVFSVLEDDAERVGFYPTIEPFRTTMLPVSDLHEIYVEESGNADGLPVLYLHGGPGAGSNPHCRRYFNPEKFRIVMFDQRGCGKSTPHACLEENTTHDLIADIEKIRDRLSIDRWLVAGGSWGSTLSIAYAQHHPERVVELILRGLFLCRDEEIKWMYQKGASYVYPDAWQHYLAPIANEHRGDLLTAYHDVLTSSDDEARIRAARAWSAWELTMMNLMPNDDIVAAMSDHYALAMARIECHYFYNKIFMRSDRELLDGIERIKHIPATLVQGRHDIVCPVHTAWEINDRWPSASLHIVPDACHAFNEPGIVDRIIRTADRYAEKRK